MHAAHSTLSVVVSVRKGSAHQTGSPRGSRVDRVVGAASIGTKMTTALPRVIPSLRPDGSGGGDDAGIYACLFDMDGTLCDTDPLHHEVFSNLLLAHGKNGGVPITTEFFHEHIAGRTNEDIFADLWPELSVPEREAMWERKEEDFRALAASKLERLPGLTELLAWIDSRGVRKVAVTNAPRPNAELMLRALGLETYFEHVVIGTECARAKPCPDPYLEGMRLVGAGDASRCVAFEDSPAGATAAVAAGIPTVGLLTSQPASALEGVGVSMCVKNFADVGLMRALESAGSREDGGGA